MADSQKLTASLKKAKKVFDKCYEKGITPSGSRWSERTRNTYFEMFSAFMRDYNQEFETANITKMTDQNKINQLIQNRMDKYHNGELSEAYNLKTLLAAINAFNHGVANTKVFKQPFSVGDIAEIRENLKEQNVIRYSKASTTLRATSDQCNEVLENIKKNGYNKEKREMAYHIGRIGLETGGRITAILKLKADDISIDTNNNRIHFIGDKGGLTRSVAISAETARYLTELKGTKQGNDRLFSSKRNNGTFLSVQETRKELSKIYSEAGDHLKQTRLIMVKDKKGNKNMTEVTVKFSSHAFRKAFALDRTKHYFNIFSSSKSVKDKYVANRIRKNPKLKEKLDTVRDKINKSRNTERNLTPQEYAIFFASVDLGHFRNDVITAFYTTFKEVRAYYKEK